MLMLLLRMRTGLVAVGDFDLDFGEGEGDGDFDLRTGGDLRGVRRVDVATILPVGKLLLLLSAVLKHHPPTRTTPRTAEIASVRPGWRFPVSKSFSTLLDSAPDHHKITLRNAGPFGLGDFDPSSLRVPPQIGG